MPVVELGTTKALDILDMTTPFSNGLFRPVVKRKYAPGYHKGRFYPEEIYVAGNEAVTFYIIHDGLVYIYHDSEEGRRVVLDLVKGPSMVGFDALGGSSVYSESAAALQETRVSCIDHRVIDQLCSFPNIEKQIRYEYSVRSQARDRLTIDRSIRPAKARVARALLMLAVEQDHANNPFLIFPHWLIGEVACLTREAVTTEIGRLKSLGLVASGRGKTSLLNGDELERIANLEGMYTTY